jgi:phosphotransferase system HPr (HPr) family protein
VVEARVALPNRAGLHARSAAMLIKATSGFESEITLSSNGRVASARSLTGILKLGARQGDIVCVRAAGHDAEQAMAVIRDMIERGFDEE